MESTYVESLVRSLHNAADTDDKQDLLRLCYVAADLIRHWHLDHSAADKVTERTR